jgi:hypothetical protein
MGNETFLVVSYVAGGIKPVFSNLILAAFVTLQGHGGEVSWNLIDMWKSLSILDKTVATLLLLLGTISVLVVALKKKNGK